MHHRPHRLWILLAAAALVGCGEADSQVRRDGSQLPHVDSIVPREVALTRFREGLEEPGGLTGGASSRDQLVRRFVEALERRDTAALVALTMTRAEFAYLFYPTAAESRAPYDLSPGLMWFTLQQSSRGGLLHALDERGGGPLVYLGYSCEGETAAGANTLWGPCLIRRLRAPGDTVVERLFGAIIERGGRYKFVSLANSL